MTDDEVDVVVGQLRNSTDFIGLIHLPTEENYIEFNVPPQSSGNWQVTAVGLRTQPDKLSELSNEEHGESLIYFGFIEKFETRDSVKSRPIGITLYRACQIEAASSDC